MRPSTVAACAFVPMVAAAQDNTSSYEENWALNGAPVMIQRLLANGMFAEAREVMATADYMLQRVERRRAMGENPPPEVILDRSCHAVIDDLSNRRYSEAAHKYASGFLDGLVSWLTKADGITGEEAAGKIRELCRGNINIPVGLVSQYITTE